jgi:flagellin-specific chaperone FliS
MNTTEKINLNLEGLNENKEKIKTNLRRRAEQIIYELNKFSESDDFYKIDEITQEVNHLSRAYNELKIVETQIGLLNRIS